MIKEKIITLPERDFHGNPIEVSFKIKQMSATQQERWINRALLLCAKAQDMDKAALVAISGGAGKDGLSFLAKLLGGLDYEKVEPLYDELLACCYHIPDPKNAAVVRPMNRNTIDEVISDYKNLYRLRLEAFKLNFGFFGNGESSPAAEQTPTIAFTKIT